MKKEKEKKSERDCFDVAWEQFEKKYGIDKIEKSGDFFEYISKVHKLIQSPPK